MNQDENAKNNVNYVGVCKEINTQINDIDGTLLKQLKANISGISSYIKTKRNAYDEVRNKYLAAKQKIENQSIEGDEEADIPNEDNASEKVATENYEQSVSEVIEGEVSDVTAPIIELPKVDIAEFKNKPKVQTEKETINEENTAKSKKTSDSQDSSTNWSLKKGAKAPIEKKKYDDKGKMSKKTMLKKGYLNIDYGYEYDDSGEIMKIRTRKSSNKKTQAVKQPIKVLDHAIVNTPIIPIKLLSEKIGKTCPEILKKLFELSIIKNINDSIGFEEAELISSEFGITLELQAEQTSEEKLTEEHLDTTDTEDNLVARPPIVTIMGHVDHGKTSILDYIRKSNVTAGEAGGITQHIGAYTVQTKNGQITFLDTPGHEAFTEMRARGADVTDIVIIVVAADDGIMPQTVEAINHAKAAKNVDIIVAINKMDKPAANKDRVIQQLADYGILAEEWGGDTPMVPVSAKTGNGVDKLLQTVLLVAELKELKANPDRNAKGVIIEAKLDKGKGPVATVLVQNGTLNNGDIIVAGTTMGKVRAMFDDKGKNVKSALPSTPVSILGLQEVPNAGDSILTVQNERLAKQVIDERINIEKEKGLKSQKVSLEDLFSKIEEGKFKDLNLIIKADVQGTEEAVKQSMVKLSNDEVKVHIVHSGVGAINEGDVSLADTTNAIIIGFNIRPDSKAKVLAEQKKIEIKLYRVIYDAINDVSAAIKGLLTPVFTQKELGEAEVRQIFKISNVGTIAGCMVTEGIITKNAQVRLVRDNVVITETGLASLRRVKDDVKEVKSGFDCGIGLIKFNDIKVGDIIQAYTMEEIDNG